MEVRCGRADEGKNSTIGISEMEFSLQASCTSFLGPIVFILHITDLLVFIGLELVHNESSHDPPRLAPLLQHR